MRWYIILLITLTVGKVAQSIAESVVGNLSYLVIPVLWVFLSRTILGWAETRRKLALLRQLPDVLAMIVRYGDPGRHSGDGGDPRRCA